MDGSNATGAPAGRATMVMTDGATSATSQGSLQSAKSSTSAAEEKSNKTTENNTVIATSTGTPPESEPSGLPSNGTTAAMTHSASNVSDEAKQVPGLPKPESIKDQGRLLSASETALAAKPTSVTTTRKEELLQQARASRLQWIRQVPFPYQNKNLSDSQREVAIDPLAPLRETHAGRQLPAALGVLEHLYGFPDRADEAEAQRLASLFQSLEVPGVVPTPEQARKMAMEEEENEQVHKKTVLVAYHAFLQNLSDPAAAMLAQGMRNFCRNMASQKYEEKETLFIIMKSYCASTYDAIQAHVLWKEEIPNDEDMMVRRSFESFVYGHCRVHIDNYLFDEPTQKKEQEWQERIESLQFIAASHLEVACLQENSLETKEILHAPIQSLLSVASYHSPFEKLQSILAMYRGINAALTIALNRAQTTTNATKKLPSADDVLPTIILTVLTARPQRLQYNLQLIEDSCPPEYLRGEAGYAYTNLYGAIQFLSDLSLDTSSDKAPDSLSISAEEFKQGMETCRAATEERRLAAEKAAAAVTASSLKEESADDGGMSASIRALLGEMSHAEVTPNDIRSARKKGEAIDIDWAMQLKKDSNPAGIETNIVATHDNEAGETSDDGPKPATVALPEGFSRSYKFLSHGPSDVTVNDLPQLLEEYRMMVHATEALLAERQAQANKDKKEQWTKSQMDLYDRVKVVDPSLLDAKSSTNGSTTTATKQPDS